MGNRLATSPIEISHDPASLERDGFWAVQVDYEGRWTLTSFAHVEDAPFPKSEWSSDSSEWKSSLDRNGYVSYVREAREAIARGDIYQVNACRILRRKSDQSLSGLFSKIISHNPSKFAAYYKSEHIEIASASPELFLSLESLPQGTRVKSSPIKGTSKSADFGEKDRAENVMIVDLIRNDLSRICVDGSIEVSRLLGVEEHPGLFHLVSDVIGTLRKNFSWSEFTDAVLPAGSISGAPKSSAREFIEEHESKRGPYCGLLGWIERRNGEVTGVLSVAIRTFWRENGFIHFGTGAGITWGSSPESEWEETELKAARLMAIADGRLA